MLSCRWCEFAVTTRFMYVVVVLLNYNDEALEFCQSITTLLRGTPFDSLTIRDAADEIAAERAARSGTPYGLNGTREELVTNWIARAVYGDRE